MKTSDIFTPNETEIDNFIAINPLALVVSKSNAGLLATPLPLMIERTGPGKATLIGHFAKANPHVPAVEQDPEVLAIFMGPHNYISPSWLTDRTQAPTWNFATVHLSARVEFDQSVDAAREAVVRLTAKMEAGRAKAWAPTELGERYERLLRGIVAFRAPVSATRVKFKLGQNERPDVLREVLVALDTEPKPDLAQLMRQANAQRST